MPGEEKGGCLTGCFWLFIIVMIPSLIFAFGPVLLAWALLFPATLVVKSILDQHGLWPKI